MADISPRRGRFCPLRRRDSLLFLNRTGWSKHPARQSPPRTCLCARPGLTPERRGSECGRAGREGASRCPVGRRREAAPVPEDARCHGPYPPSFSRPRSRPCSSRPVRPRRGRGITITAGTVMATSPRGSRSGRSSPSSRSRTPATTRTRLRRATGTSITEVTGTRTPFTATCTGRPVTAGRLPGRASSPTGTVTAPAHGTFMRSATRAPITATEPDGGLPTPAAKAAPTACGRRPGAHLVETPSRRSERPVVVSLDELEADSLYNPTPPSCVAWSSACARLRGHWRRDGLRPALQHQGVRRGVLLDDHRRRWLQPVQVL